MMKWKQKFQFSLLLLIWRNMKVKVKNKKNNDRIDEETSESEDPDSVVPTVNDAGGISLTIPVGIQEGVMKKIKN